MLILLPPSEGKAAPARGAPVALDSLIHPVLTAHRERLVRAVDRELLSAPAAPAARVYAGVLFQQLDLERLARRARGRHVLIFSGLWGLLAPGDRIPAYKLPIAAKVPRVGPLAAYWRPALTDVLPDRGLVLDLRSGGYAAAWRPRQATVMCVRGFSEGPGGERRVISHMVKRIRGEVARHVLDVRATPKTPEAVAEIAAAAGMRVDLTGEGRELYLDVIETAA